MRCDKCGTEMVCDETKILTSIPPQKEYTCPNCKNVAYKHIEPEWVSIPKPLPYQTGWVCPKCGAVMSPYQNVCPNCTPAQKLDIWC